MKRKKKSEKKLRRGIELALFTWMSKVLPQRVFYKLSHFAQVI